MKRHLTALSGLVLAVALFLPAGTAFANDMGPSGKGHGKPGNLMDRCGIMKQLDLSEAQKTQLREKRQAKMAGWQSNKERRHAAMASLTPAARKAKRAEMHEHRKAEMKSILTPSQFSKFEQLSANCKMQHQEDRMHMKQK